MFQRKSLCSLVSKLSRDLVQLTSKNAYLRSTASFLANSAAIKSRAFSHMSSNLGKTAASYESRHSSSTPSSTRSFSSKSSEKASDSSKDQQKTSTSELVIQHGKNGIVEIQLNRMEAKNALSKKLIFELEIFLNSVQNDNRLRCVIVRSLIPGVFCAGADLKERLKMEEKDVGPFVSRLRKTFDDLSDLHVPVIAAIDGVALGGGLELALACDLRVCATNSKLGLVETKLAIIPGAGGTQRLSRIIGVAKAKELIYTSKVVDGVEAEKIGLVNMAVPQNEQKDAAYKKALELANQIVANGPIAIQMAKRAIDKGIQVDIDSALQYEELCYSRVIPTKDRIEGLNAFKEKRPPKYIGE